MASYWGGKYMALRRAQKPSALGDDVTGAINLLVRLLPLVQMILMYHLYFQVPYDCAGMLTHGIRHRHGLLGWPTRCQVCGPSFAKDSKCCTVICLELPLVSALA